MTPPVPMEPNSGHYGFCNNCNFDNYIVYRVEHDDKTVDCLCETCRARLQRIYKSELHEKWSKYVNW